MLSDDDDLTDYEKARDALIARNRARMAAMGLLGAANVFETKALALKAKTSSQKKKKTQPRPRRPRPKEEEQPTRTSKRLRGEKAPASDDTTAKEEADAEEYSPSPSPPRWTEAELQEIKAEEEQRQRAKMNERLSELDIAGLIDYSPGLAHFAIIGAPHKGQRGRKHYRVAFSKEKTKAKATTTTACECPDYRIRRKAKGDHCKHIRLVMTQLGIEGEDKQREKESIEGWERALERVVMASSKTKKG